MTILLKPEDYYTQRNNKFKPFEACMPTSWTMWAIAAGLKERLLTFCESKEISIDVLDNYAMEYLNTTEAGLFADKKYPSLRPIYPPNQIHGMFHSYLEPHIFGEPVSDFLPQSLSFGSILDLIKSGHPLWSSGAFDGVHGPIDGHAVAFVGENSSVLFLADPYGDYRSRYESQKGYLIPMAADDFKIHIKPVNSGLKNIHIRRGVLQ